MERPRGREVELEFVGLEAGMTSVGESGLSFGGRGEGFVGGRSASAGASVLGSVRSSGDRRCCGAGAVGYAEESGGATTRCGVGEGDDGC